MLIELKAVEVDTACHTVAMIVHAVPVNDMVAARIAHVIYKGPHQLARRVIYLHADGFVHGEIEADLGQRVQGFPILSYQVREVVVADAERWEEEVEGG